MSLERILDFLRTHFVVFVAVALPLAGVVLAIVRYTAGDREDALRIAVASVFGFCIYALLLQ